MHLELPPDARVFRFRDERLLVITNLDNDGLYVMDAAHQFQQYRVTRAPQDGLDGNCVHPDEPDTAIRFRPHRDGLTFGPQELGRAPDAVTEIDYKPLTA